MAGAVRVGCWECHAGRSKRQIFACLLSHPPSLCCVTVASTRIQLLRLYGSWQSDNSARWRVSLQCSEADEQTDGRGVAHGTRGQQGV